MHTYLAEVDEKGAGGSIHAIVAVAGVWAPHLSHPLRKRKEGKIKSGPHMHSHPNHPLHSLKL